MTTAEQVAAFRDRLKAGYAVGSRAHLLHILAAYAECDAAVVRTHRDFRIDVWVSADRIDPVREAMRQHWVMGWLVSVRPFTAAHRFTSGYHVQQWHGAHYHMPATQ
ncbi:TPA: hypothetical protein QDB21_005629 [Burkholderia vietnamiensis]|nr:hypothetical protein [Burkholderia vietnamiensis]